MGCRLLLISGTEFEQDSSVEVYRVLQDMTCTNEEGSNLLLHLLVPLLRQILV